MPEPGPGKVRIKVEACGICHSDTFTVEGQIPGNAKALSALIDAVWMASCLWPVRRQSRAKSRRYN